MPKVTLKTAALLLADLEGGLANLTSGLRLYVIDQNNVAYHAQAVITDAAAAYVALTIDTTQPVPIGT